MASELLKNVREYEQLYSKYADPERPQFHVTGAIGWINDPNGFSTYKGEYHLFFQYHPYSVKWGPMYWGHVKTKDFVKWEYLPAAIAPDTPADQNGCFSGSAIEMPDGRQLLMYTGVNIQERPDGMPIERQQQCIAIGDGINYEKYDGNPVLTAKDLPEGASPVDFRDPHIFKMGETYYCVIGSRPADGSGSILLYKSADALHWEFVSVLDASYTELGRMWECPDIFPLDNQWIILTSPQEMAPMGMEFHAGYGNLALIGQFDVEKGTFSREHVQALDYGIDFYAPQTLESYDGRRIMIAWMENWATVDSKLMDKRLFGCMTLPRELTFRNGRVCQAPVREIENYRGRKVFYENVLIIRETNLAGIKGRWLDMTVNVRPVNNQPYTRFKINLAKDGEHGVVIRYKPATSTIRIDRSRNGGRFDVVHVREFQARPDNGQIKFRIIMDGNRVEMFINDGEQAASFKLYNKDFAADSISFDCDGVAQIDVEKYELKMV